MTDEQLRNYFMVLKSLYKFILKNGCIVAYFPSYNDIDFSSIYPIDLIFYTRLDKNCIRLVAKQYKDNYKDWIHEYD